MRVIGVNLIGQAMVAVAADDGVLLEIFDLQIRRTGINPLFPALWSGPTAASGANRQKQIPSRNVCFVNGSSKFRRPYRG